MLGISTKRSQSAMVFGHKDVESINKLREALMQKTKHQGKKSSQAISVEKQILKINDAKKARVFRPVPCRVSSAVKGPRPMGYSFLSVCDRGHSDPNTDTSHILAQSCDVLGPFACSDCIRARYRTKYTEETTKCFPELAINQRVLCAQSRMEYMFQNEKGNSKQKQCKTSQRYKNIEDALEEKNKSIPPVPSFTRVVTDNEVQLRVMEDVRHRPEEKPGFITGGRRFRTKKVKEELGKEQKNLLGPILVDSEKEANRKNWNVIPAK